MAKEPLTIFSTRIDPRSIVESMRQYADEIELDGAPEGWRTLIARGPRRLLRRRLELTIVHDSNYYLGPRWPNQIGGLLQHCAALAGGELRPELGETIQNLRFAVGLPAADLDLASDDPRLDWLFAVCRRIDGLIFTPTSLRDAQGRVFFSSCEPADRSARLPSISVDDSAPAMADESENDEPAPPSPQRVAQRALVLCALANRGLIENESGSSKEFEEDCEAMLEWLEELALLEEIEPEELDVMRCPLGEMDSQTMIDAIWRIEGLGVLFWALHLHELPAYDETVVPLELFEVAGMFDPRPARQLIQNAKLRSANELAAYQTHALMFHWRLRNFFLHPGPVDFVEMSEKGWFGPFDISTYRIVGRDLAIGEVGIHEANPQLINKCNSLAAERHRAINWLCGEGDLYSEIDTST
ncbi:MAG: DUF4272 domain-containing protein [Pirellulales bacterium]|nr:DUF4272 domain-containing protein [Pirellulales bacterium]